MIPNGVDPVMPAGCQVPLGGDSFAQVDRLDAWDCTLSVFHPMEEIPECLKVKWGRITAEVLRRIEEATSDTELTRALKWWLVLPQALLRQAKRGGTQGPGGSTGEGKVPGCSGGRMGKGTGSPGGRQGGHNKKEGGEGTEEAGS